MTNGQYFLIYDYSGKRFVVWYNIDGSGTAPDGVYDNTSFRGINSIFLEVDLSGSGDSGNATSTATLMFFKVMQHFPLHIMLLKMVIF